MPFEDGHQHLEDVEHPFPGGLPSGGTCNHDGELYTDPGKSYREVLPEKFSEFGYAPEDFAPTPGK